MCGIVGIFDLKSDEESKRKPLKKMIATLQHRGPDAWGLYTSKEMAIGHTRLSIIDISDGNQPMTTDRYAIGFNGEIYNYIELREELIRKGIHFRTKSDTEVVLKAVEYFGTNAFSKFNGEFALIIWDRLKKRIIAARDRFGIRPLYILNFDERLYFSSELKAFDSINNFNRNFDLQKLLEHALFWNTIGDETIFKHIKSVQAGTFRIYRSPWDLTEKRYYEIGEAACDSKNKNLKNATEEFKNLLDDSVRLRLRSDVPVGTYLSGGIDSSVITYLAKEKCQQKLKTFSVTFEDAEYDESVYQEMMTDHLRTEHHKISIDYKSINDAFFTAAYHFERPVFRTAAVPLFLLSEKVKSQGIKVVLTGEGADEILYGYDVFKELKLLRFWGKRPQSLIRPLLIKKLYPHLNHFKNAQRFGLMKMYYQGFLDRYNNTFKGLNIRLNNNQIVSKYLRKDAGATIDEEKLIRKVEAILPQNFYQWSILQQNQFLEMKTLLSGYLLSSQGDRMSMAHSVEGRYPFLDHRLVEKVFYYPDEYKMNGFKQKHLLSEAFKDALPDAIINRPKRPYMAPDLKSFYYEGKLSEQASYFLSEELLKDSGIFDAKMIESFLKKFATRIPTEVGYRDNMLITFILSCQSINHWARNPQLHPLNEDMKTVDIIDNAQS